MIRIRLPDIPYVQAARSTMPFKSTQLPLEKPWPKTTPNTHSPRHQRRDFLLTKMHAHTYT
eukprot:m.158723 g.158723  ORF g.158723 m.158723 type:complete len:61 (+) comp14338_c0_seq20:9970-10152(+)